MAILEEHIDCVVGLKSANDFDATNRWRGLTVHLADESGNPVRFGFDRRTDSNTVTKRWRPSWEVSFHNAERLS
jgi:hypothetical protein